MKSRAAVAFAAGKPLEVVEVDVEGGRRYDLTVEVQGPGSAACVFDAP